MKSVLWERTEDRLRLVYDRREQLVIPDPDGAVERLLRRLREGGRTVDELAEQLSVPRADVAAALATMDRYGLVEDGDRLDRLPEDVAERYFSNLAFFESFASLSRSREDLQRSLWDAHVLVLGTGGLNSNVIPHLCGLGVGRLTLLDRDAVEARNFARQYLYRWADVGARKVERAAAWVREFDPGIKVEVVDGSVGSAEQLAELLAEVRPSVVAAGIDHPDQVDRWVNAACVAHGVPFVRGGMYVTEGIVFSVQPGVSGCLACVPAATEVGDDPALADELAAFALYSAKPRRNRGIGPVAGLLGALAAFEVLRYLTGFEAPVYAGRPVLLDFAAGCATRRLDWPRDPACLVCGDPPERR